MRRFRIEARGPYSFRSTLAFLRSFPPCGHGWIEDGGDLCIGFPLEGVGPAVGARVRAVAGGLEGEAYGDAPTGAVARQLARVFSLDHDGTAYPEVGRRDPAVGRLMQSMPGFRPLCFFSPYEAAAYAQIGHHISMAQASRIKARLVAEHGDEVSLAGARVRAFPSPERLLDVTHLPGLPAGKLARMHGIARAALAGELDAERLRGLGEERAKAALRTLEGVGPWTAAAIWLRGTGVRDSLAAEEPRCLAAAARLDGKSAPLTPAELATRAEPWRPYRTWVIVLLRFALGPNPGEVARPPRATRLAPYDDVTKDHQGFEDHRPQDGRVVEKRQPVRAAGADPR